MRPIPARTFIIPAVVLLLAPIPTLAARSSAAAGTAPSTGHSHVHALLTADTGGVHSARSDGARPGPLGVPVAFATSSGAAPSARAAASDAHDRLARHVGRSSHMDALQLAFQAYYNYRSTYPERVRKPYLYYVDLGLDNRTPRGWVFDMDALQLVEGPFHVAHGVGSSRQRDAVPTVFSNRPGSKASSLGLYLAEETYGFRGRAGGGTYSSVGLRMRGESGSFNDAARRRGIVAHGAPYVTFAEAGRSEGCPAMEQHRARRLLPLLADGGVVFIFSPRDPVWMRSDPWIHAE